jgi:cytochrome c biogenesis protein
MLKRIAEFVGSVRFGIVLLGLVIFFSFVGSLIPQTFEPSWYLINYPQMGNVILTLGLHRIFAQWYFVAVCALLCLSLLYATVSRFIQVREQKKNMFVVPENGYHPKELDEHEISCLRGYLEKKRYKQISVGESAIFYKNLAGYYGSVLIPLSLLFILVFGGAVLALTQIADVLVLPRETVTLNDGTRLTVHSFRMYDEYGARDYASIIDVVAPDGRSSGLREITVNRPLRFNAVRYYQFSFLYAGSITVIDMDTGGWDRFYMVERSFLTNEDNIGIWFETVFQGWTEDAETGRIIPLVYDAPIFPNPIYYIMVIREDGQEPMFALPGSFVQTGNLLFEFNDLINYPGIRATSVPHPFPTLLYISFGIIIIAFFLTFYHQPAVLTLSGNRYKLVASNSSGVRIEIDALFDDDNGDEGVGEDGEDGDENKLIEKKDEPNVKTSGEMEVDI